MDTAQNKMWNKNFNLVIIGQIISLFGSAMLRFALSLYVMDITGREDIFAGLFAISNIPILLSPLGGAIADRFNRRNLMVIFDFSSSFVVFIFILLLAQNGHSILLIGVVMVLLSVISAMYTPTVTASIPQLVEESSLAGANGIVQAVQALSYVVAPVCAGILYGIMSVQALIAVSGAAFFLSAVMEIFIRIPFVKRQSEGAMLKTIGRDMKEGFVFVAKQPFILKAMLIAALINFILTPLFVVGGPIILRMTMKSTDTIYGIGMGIIQFANILGALLIG
ncbi:MFS transporter, partial [Robinsoniella sp.]